MAEVAPNLACEPGDQPRIRDVLRNATDRLRECLRDAPAGSAETPYLDALLLLAMARGESTERLMASLPDRLEPGTLTGYSELIEKRCAGAPVSYIRGCKEFYGRTFRVSPAVLVPRPETEELVEQTLTLIRDMEAGTHIHDACTGSGCIAVTIAAERPDLQVTASDVSEDALRVARENAGTLLPADEQPPFWQSDLLAGLARRLERGTLAAPRIITANPPYLTDTDYERMHEAGWPEPDVALRAGPDGLALVRRLAREAVTILPSGGYLVLEVGQDQGLTGERVLAAAGFSEVTVYQDLSGRDRILIGRRA